jgi:GNAT superfamily N-acetyltransferase
MPFARSVHHAALRDVVERQFGSWDEPAQDQFFLDDWDDGPFDIILCDGAPCGYILVDERPDTVIMREILLMPQYQNKGIGTALIKEIQQRAHTRQVPVTLGTLHANNAARLYRRLGFHDTARTPTHIIMQWP